MEKRAKDASGTCWRWTRTFFKIHFSGFLIYCNKAQKNTNSTIKKVFQRLSCLRPTKLFTRSIKGKKKYYIQYNGNKHSEKSLMSALKREKPLDEVALREWDSRVANKILALLGREERR